MHDVYRRTPDCFPDIRPIFRAEAAASLGSWRASGSSETQTSFVQKFPVRHEQGGF